MTLYKETDTETGSCGSIPIMSGSRSLTDPGSNPDLRPFPDLNLSPTQEPQNNKLEKNKQTNRLYKALWYTLKSLECKGHFSFFKLKGNKKIQSFCPNRQSICMHARHISASNWQLYRAICNKGILLMYRL